MTIRIPHLIAFGIIAIQAAILVVFHHPLICACGHISLWAGQVLSPENSQQLTDWYTPSHIIHGILFYGLLRLLFPRMSIGWRLALAVGIEVSWEIIENTPWVINHYREQALAQGYTGDSVINSVSDTIAMMLGFLAARTWPIWVSFAFVIALELFTMYFIRDGLFLNIINLIYPLPFISAWQSGLL